MNILEHRALPGPNPYSPYPTVYMLLDIAPYADRATDEMPELRQNLLRLLPSLTEHRCSLNRRGGFVERLERGTWLGHVVEHVAIELQCLAGIRVGFGKTRETNQHGVYSVVYRYRDEEAGLEAGRFAVELVEAAANGQDVDIHEMVDILRDLARRNAIGPSTDAILREARRRGIPVLRLNDASYLQLGHGARQQRIQASMSGRTSCIGAEIADDKQRTKDILKRAGVPVPRGEVVGSLEGAKEVAEDLGYPVVVKPLVGNHGRGVTTNLRTPAELEAAFAVAKSLHRDVLVEQFLEGQDFRVLIIGNRFVAAARRDPACVTGDGVHSIQQLVDIVNEDPRRGNDHEGVLTKIRIDDESMRMLGTQGMTPDTIPPSGVRVCLKGTANLSAGGTAVDVTNEVHPQVRRMCERAARFIGLDIMGLDIVAPHLRQPLSTVRGGVVEVNAAPGLRMHAFPNEGTPRNVGAPIVDMLFPGQDDGRIPVVAVTGTNGKTTTVRLIAHILERQGGKVGLATTGGVEIAGDFVASGDYSGPAGAQLVLQDPLVDHAVLEVARGGILRRGLGFDRASVGVFLNVASDHLGESGIDTIDDLAEVKSVVVESVGRDGTSVLNADDPYVRRYADTLRSRVILFSMDPESQVVAEHVARAGKVVTVRDGHVVLRDVLGDESVCAVRDIPITMDGAAAFNVQNAMAAVAATHALGVPTIAIREALETFRPTPQQLPGRMNLIEMGAYKVLVDYGHNVPALQALAPVVEKLASGRAIAMANASGNRRDEDIRAFGKMLASMYDQLFVCDPDPRRRVPGETVRLLVAGAQEGGLAPGAIAECETEAEAIRRALGVAQPGDLVVIQADNVDMAIRLVEDHRTSMTGERARPAHLRPSRKRRPEDAEAEAPGLEPAIEPRI